MDDELEARLAAIEHVLEMVTGNLLAEGSEETQRLILEKFREASHIPRVDPITGERVSDKIQTRLVERCESILSRIEAIGLGIRDGRNPL